MALEQLQWEDGRCSLTYHEGIIADGFILERCSDCGRYICYECGTRNEYDAPLCITCAKKEIIDRYFDCITRKYVYVSISKKGKVPARRFIGFWKWLSETYELRELWDLSCSRVIENYLWVTRSISIPENKDAKVGTVQWLIL